jgi:superfamily II DNA or RNA helicase
MTYAKLINTDAEELEAIRPGYIVLDEFHRCGAVEWGKGVERLLNVYPTVPTLGLSATNIRYLDNQRDMADELFDGHVASEMTLGEALAKNILLPPVYVTSIYSCQKDLEKYQQRVRKAKNPAVRDAAQKYLDALRRELAKADGLEDIFDKHIQNRTGKYLVFCANTEHMWDMIEHTPAWFAKVDDTPHLYSVYAEDAVSIKTFEAFKYDDSAHLKLLFCIDMLNEGVHVENVSGVILFRPTVSPIIYKQQIGRAL